MSFVVIFSRGISVLRGVFNMDMTLTEFGKLFVSSIPLGFLAGCIPMLIGSVVHGVMKIFKQA